MTAMIERTFVMLKPDAVKRGLIGEIIHRIERKGYRICEAKTMTLSEPSCGALCTSDRQTVFP